MQTPQGHQMPIHTLIRKIIQEEIVPDVVPLGELVMIFKNRGSSDDPSKFRPVTCKRLAVWLLYRLQVSSLGIES